MCPKPGALSARGAATGGQLRPVTSCSCSRTEETCGLGSGGCAWFLGSLSPSTCHFFCQFASSWRSHVRLRNAPELSDVLCRSIQSQFIGNMLGGSGTPYEPSSEPAERGLRRLLLTWNATAPLADCSPAPLRQQQLELTVRGSRRLMRQAILRLTNGARGSTLSVENTQKTTTK